MYPLSLKFFIYIFCMFFLDDFYAVILLRSLTPTVTRRHTDYFDLTCHVGHICDLKKVLSWCWGIMLEEVGHG